MISPNSNSGTSVMDIFHSVLFIEKSLYLAEAVLKSGYGDDLLDFLQKNEDLIEELMEANKRNVRTKAKDVAKMLGMKTSGGAKSRSVAVNVPAPVVQQTQEDLLNFGASEPAPAPKQDDLFSTPATSGGDMFSGMTTSEPEKTTDMFGSMSLGDVPYHFIPLFFSGLWANRETQSLQYRDNPYQ